MKITFLTRSIVSGGAERQLIILAQALARRGHDVSVFSFYDEDQRVDGVRIVGLGKTGRWDVPVFLGRLLAALRRERPAILHGYLPMANVLTAVVRPFLRETRIVFGVRAADMKLQAYDWVWSLAHGLEAVLAQTADLVICNSQAAYDAAARAGFPRARLRVIYNGIDTGRFRPDAAARERLRAAHGLSPEACLVGVVARLDPMKDHDTFLSALALLAPARAELRALIVGDGPQRERLKAEAFRLGLSGRILRSEARPDIEAVYPALDVLCLPSAFGESFPNVIGEAMACGVPCIATELGDVRQIIGETGRVVPRVRDPEALAGALAELVDMAPDDRRALGVLGRSRIETRFGIERMVDTTEDVFRALLNRTGGPD